MGMSPGSGGPGAPMSEINITPFVDVMLVLLIIFMITAPMMGKGVELDLPKAKAQPMEVDESKLVMTIDAERRVFLGETQIPHERLEEALDRRSCDGGVAGNSGLVDHLPMHDGYNLEEAVEGAEVLDQCLLLDLLSQIGVDVGPQLLDPVTLVAVDAWK